MKGARLHVAIYTTSSLLTGLLMAVLAWNESWSQNHSTEYDPFLYLTLVPILAAFLTASYKHPERLREITKVKKYLFWGKSQQIRVEHLLRLTGLFFGGVIVFGVNHPNWLVETLHLAFTGLAILTGYTMMLIYPESKKGRVWSWIGFVVGGSGFLMAFLFQSYSIAWGEVIASIPLAFWMFNTWIFKD